MNKLDAIFGPDDGEMLPQYLWGELIPADIDLENDPIPAMYLEDFE